MLKKLFGFDPSVTTPRTEILAGVTTFLTMSYILAVNPGMFSQLDGMPAGAVFTATALAAITGTLIMSLWAKLPFGLAPGMGLNAFFVFSVCMGMGYPWQFALTAVFIEGIIFVILTLTNLREAIVNAIPASLKNAIGAGIGLFIAFIGLQNAGIISNNDSTLVSLGEITSGSPLLAMIGLAVTSVLVVKNVRGALLIGILITTVIGIPMGITNYGGLVSAPHSIAPIFCKFEWSQIWSLEYGGGDIHIPLHRHVRYDRYSGGCMHQGRHARCQRPYSAREAGLHGRRSGHGGWRMLRHLYDDDLR